MALSPKFGYSSSMRKAFQWFIDLAQKDKEKVERMITDSAEELLEPFARAISTQMNSNYKMGSYHHQKLGNEHQYNDVVANAYFVNRRGRRWALRAKFFLLEPSLYFDLYRPKLGLGYEARQAKRRELIASGATLIWDVDETVLKTRPYGWIPGMNYRFERTGKKVMSNWVKDAAPMLARELAKAFESDVVIYAMENKQQ